MNMRASLTTDANDGVYAKDQAKEVRRRKKERRYVKDGSGRCHVFLVSVNLLDGTHMATHLGTYACGNI
jgi:hypothetical protein